MDVEPELEPLMFNSLLTEHFQILAKDLEVLEPKTPEDIYKSHLVETRMTVTGNTDS